MVAKAKAKAKAKATTTITATAGGVRARLPARRARAALVRSRVTRPVSVSPRLVADVSALVESARGAAARQLSMGLGQLYWAIGRRIRTDVLRQERAEYGKRVIVGLAQTLSRRYGRGFGEKSLFHMVRFAEVFPDPKIVSALLRELTWSHFLALIYLEPVLKREFYAELCRIERWDTRTLQHKIRTMLYERTALSRKPDQLARTELAALRDHDALSPDLVFRDPYLLDFLSLPSGHNERDLETAMLRELGDVILELGVGFTFVARQKRIVIDGRDYYLDLLFYHRRLRRLVAVELKLGEFRATDKGQMELYLRWLARHERMPGEDAPLGVILCAGKSDEHVELLEMRRSSIRVAEYLTDLPPQDVLRRRLHHMVTTARARQPGHTTGPTRTRAGLAAPNGSANAVHRPRPATRGDRRSGPARAGRAGPRPQLSKRAETISARGRTRTP